MSAVFNGVNYEYASNSNADKQADTLLNSTPTTINGALDQYAARRYKLVQALKEGNYIQDPDGSELSTADITNILLSKNQTGESSGTLTISAADDYTYYVQVKKAEGEEPQSQTYSETVSFSAGYYPHDFSVSAILNVGDDTLNFTNLSNLQIANYITKHSGATSIEIKPEDYSVDYYNSVILNIITDDSLTLSYTAPQPAGNGQSAIQESLVISTSTTNGGFLTSGEHKLDATQFPTINSTSSTLTPGLYRVPETITVIPTEDNPNNITSVTYDGNYSYGTKDISVKYNTYSSGSLNSGNSTGSITYNTKVTLPLANTNITNGEFKNDASLGVVFQGTIDEPGWVEATTFSIALDSGDYVEDLTTISNDSAEILALNPKDDNTITKVIQLISEL